MYAMLNKKVMDFNINSSHRSKSSVMKNADQDIPETMDLETAVKIQMVEHQINDLVA
jgi:hypothetical protein